MRAFLASGNRTVTGVLIGFWGFYGFRCVAVAVGLPEAVVVECRVPQTLNSTLLNPKPLIPEPSTF